MCQPSKLYKDYSTRHPLNGTPALLHFENLRDMIEASENLPDLDCVEREMNIAELSYGDDKWATYAATLARLHFGRRVIIAKQLLTSKAA